MLKAGQGGGRAIDAEGGFKSLERAVLDGMRTRKAHQCLGRGAFAIRFGEHADHVAFAKPLVQRAQGWPGHLIATLGAQKHKTGMRQVLQQLPRPYTGRFAQVPGIKLDPFIRAFGP